MSEFLRHMRARDVNVTWLGWQLTATNRDTGRVVRGGLSDFIVHPSHAHVTLYMGGVQVELRGDDTVSAGSLDVPGAA